MTRLKNSLGFSAVEALLILVIVGILGFTGWFVYHSRQAANKDYNSQPASQITTTQKTTPTYKVPTGYVTYKYDGMSFVYPEAWKKSSNEQFITIVDDSQAAIYQGCGDEACAVRYDPVTRTWKGANVNENSGTGSVAESGNAQAYLIPIMGEMNCGSWAALIHADNKFAQVRLSICTKPGSSMDIEPSGGQLLYDDVVTQLKEVVKSVDKA